MSKKKSAARTRNLEKTRNVILKVTFMEVFKHGFQGVSIDDIVAKTKLTKGALYHQFPTKLDLGYALVEEVITPMIIERWITPLEAFENPVEGILRQMQRLMGEANPKHLKLGCPLNNLVQEMAPLDHGFRVRLEKALNLWIDEMERHLKRAQEKGLLRKDVKAKDAARFIVMAHEGFYGMMKGLDDPSIFLSLFTSLSNYFKTLTPQFEQTSIKIS